LIEADGKRLFYSADFQGHGPKRAIFEEMLRNPPGDLDVMLMEGTNVQEAGGHPPGRTEQELREDIAATVAAAEGMVLVTYSSQSIDRLSTMYSAARRTGRTLVVDLMTAAAAQATGRDTIPQPGWEQLLVYVPFFLRRQIVKDQSFELLPKKEHRIFPEDFAKRRKELMVTFRMSMARDLERAECLKGAIAIWSQWPGYLDQPEAKRYRDFLTEHDIPRHVHHASGHAYVPDLQRLARAIAPERLVPIHSFGAVRFPELFENVEIHSDGEWWEV
jgi:ribonuclease J